MLIHLNFQTTVFVETFVIETQVILSSQNVTFFNKFMAKMSTAVFTSFCVSPFLGATL